MAAAQVDGSPEGAAQDDAADPECACDDLDAEASDEVERLVAIHPPETINRLVANNGLADSPDGENQ